MTQFLSDAVLESVKNKPSLPVFLDPATLPTLTLVIAQDYSEDRHSHVLAKQILKHTSFPEDQIHVTHFTSLDWASRFCVDNTVMQKQLIIGDMTMSIRCFPMDAEKHLKELRHQLKVTNRKMIICMGGFTKQNYKIIPHADSVLQLVVARDFIEERSDKTLYGLCCRKWRGELDTPQYYSFLK